MLEKEIAKKIKEAGELLYKFGDSLENDSQGWTKSRNNKIEGKTKTHFISPSSQKEHTSILVLVINAENNEDIIEKLNNQKKVKTEMWEKVYRSTEALWIGTEEHFKHTGLKNRFSNTDQINQRSEYDVYFIQIKLQEVHSGFRANASSLKRADAFEALSNTEHKVIDTSPRLSVLSTNNLPLYRS